MTGKFRCIHTQFFFTFCLLEECFKNHNSAKIILQFRVELLKPSFMSHNHLSLHVRQHVKYYFCLNDISSGYHVIKPVECKAYAGVVIDKNVTSMVLWNSVRCDRFYISTKYSIHH